MIQITDLHYRYPDGTYALRGVNLRIRAGEFAALIGPNGAGKSTLLLHLNGILQGCGGVRISGLKMTKSNLREIRQMVGIVFQNPDDMLFSPTVYEDIAFGPKNLGLPQTEIRSRVAEAMRRVGMDGFGDRNPHHLSQGQKKLISIAAILSMRPRIMIFDEPGAHLDPKGKRDIIGLIQSLDCTKIIATHDLSLLTICDAVHIMNCGRISYSGRSADAAVLAEHGLV
ncbi:MAG: ATP-binding cassette domain-containing protein [archaeon]